MVPAGIVGVAAPTPGALDFLELPAHPPGRRVGQYQSGQAARAPRPLLGRHLERGLGRVGHLVEVERVHAERVPPEPTVRAGVAREHEDAAPPVQQGTLHRDEVHPVDHRVDEQDVVQPQTIQPRIAQIRM